MPECAAAGFAAQGIYRGWQWFGAPMIAALIADAALAALRASEPPAA